MLTKRLAKVLRKECGLIGAEKLLVGVSGGPDSLTLLDILSKHEFLVVVAHFDHQLRSESSADAHFVKTIAEKKGFVFVYESGNTLKFAEDQKLTIEEAARRLRYQFLFYQAIKHNASAVVVGHNADDQVETVMMHLIRGAGMDGLTGMQFRSLSEWSSNIPLLRPLLGVWRSEVINYCTENGLEPCFDLSNSDLTYFRNRLRHVLIPTLQELNPKIKKLILNLTKTISEDKAILNNQVHEFVEKYTLEKSSNHIALNLHAFSKEQLGLQRRVLRKSISLLRPGLRDIGFDAIEHALVALSNPPSTGQTDLIAGLKIQVEGDRFILSDWEASSFRALWPQILPEQEIKLFAPGRLNLENNWILNAAILEPSEEIKASIGQNRDFFTAYMDLLESGQNILIRSRQPGDRFTPLGMGGNSIKISDFMINEKLPKRARNNWPLFYSQDKIIWVPGYRISDHVKVTKKTQKILQVVLKKQ